MGYSNTATQKQTAEKGDSFSGTNAQRKMGAVPVLQKAEGESLLPRETKTRKPDKQIAQTATPIQPKVIQPLKIKPYKDIIEVNTLNDLNLYLVNAIGIVDFPANTTIEMINKALVSSTNSITQKPVPREAIIEILRPKIVQLIVEAADPYFVVPIDYREIVRAAKTQEINVKNQEGQFYGDPQRIHIHFGAGWMHIKNGNDKASVIQINPGTIANAIAFAIVHINEPGAIICLKRLITLNE